MVLTVRRRTSTARPVVLRSRPSLQSAGTRVSTGSGRSKAAFGPVRSKSCAPRSGLNCAPAFLPVQQDAGRPRSGTPASRSTSSNGEPRRVPGPQPGSRGHGVVARLPDDGVVVAQHAEGVRRPPTVGVHVVDVGGDAVGGQGVARTSRGTSGPPRPCTGDGAGVVLGRDHEGAGVPDSDGGLVGERRGSSSRGGANQTCDRVAGLVPLTWPRTTRGSSRRLRGRTRRPPFHSLVRTGVHAPPLIC